MADGLTETMRAQDTVARLGGDEFCVLAPETDGPRTVPLARRIAETVAEATAGIETLSASVGVAVFPRDGTSAGGPACRPPTSGSSRPSGAEGARGPPSARPDTDRAGVEPAQPLTASNRYSPGMAEAAKNRPRRSRELAQVVPLVAFGIILLGSLVYLLALALGGARLIKFGLAGLPPHLSTHDPRPWLIAATAAALATLVACGLAELRLRKLEGVAEAERQARADEQEARQRLAEAQEETQVLRERQSEASAERDAAMRNWQQARQWNKELRDQVVRLQRELGILARPENVREVVLALTMNLAEAEKGILLSDRAGPDGELRVVCSLGFQNDPQESAIAQRFATEVIERDTTLREDDGPRLDHEKRTAADEEVQNLLAIPVYVLDDFSGVIICANRDGWL